MPSLIFSLISFAIAVVALFYMVNTSRQVKRNRLLNRFPQVEELCRTNGRGVHKRIDENRELLELLQQRKPDLLEDCPWIEGWLESQDHFLVSLATIVGTENQCARLDGSFPRPWPSMANR